MDKLQQKIMNIMTIYYCDKNKALEWYNKSNVYFKYGFKEEASPKEMVEAGKGQEVIDWLELILY